jgi:peptide/nickel transport system permease protein
MTVRAYLVRRLALLVFVLAGIVVVTFFIVRIVPSNPAQLYLGSRARADQVARVRHELGLDRSLVVQFAVYVRDLAAGDWGESLRTRRGVLGDILHFLPASLELIFTAMFIAAIVGIIIGALSAHKKGRSLDHGGRIAAIAGVSLPAFFLALLLQIIFFRTLKLLPVAGQIDTMVAQAHPVQHVTGMLVVDALITGNFVAFWDGLRHLILPALALAAYPAGLVMRMTRSAMLEALESDHVKMARAMGVRQRVIVFQYGLKNSMAPVLTVIGLMFAYALVGTFFVEMIFAWPGLGTYATLSILSLDYPAIMGVTIVVALIYVLVNLIVDLLIGWIDPRVVLS